jgi:hypothetical protein
MTVDVVCVGTPFLDLIFRGLPVMPSAGEEVLAAGVVIVPGAMANVAFAMRQLGLEAVVCAPVGTDATGRFLYASHSLARPATRQKGLTRAVFSDAIASTTGPEAWMLEVRG